ncbi:hypothetical protein APUTEX25_003921 [Auxenochlorella protothecoides]|uniref:HMG box domain-containing protein n=1 Tax=Auxenochlorella protothecoides TaxID=3075 RepID=A0A3M7KWQ0_AUXPR|nr:hypothetical protein APUTEX25_003921 [Auxenochlorella protothecoides]|eukprot:RMZ53782.1 hypothetical protein APUTEX25_003921 [Auxenochlorella protothecoides]
MFGRLYCAARYGSRGGPYVGCCQEPILEAVHVPGPSPRGAPQLGPSLAVPAALPVQQQQRQKLEYQEPLVASPEQAAGAEAASPSAAAGEGGAEAEEPAGPSTPPRPKSAFFYYLEAFKDQWRAEHPRATPQVKTLSQLASVSWRAMTGVWAVVVRRR